MTQKWELAGDYSVEIWFRIAKDGDGYSESKNWEQLARPVLERDDYFQLESIPFYLKNVSRGFNSLNKVFSVRRFRVPDLRLLAPDS